MTLEHAVPECEMISELLSFGTGAVISVVLLLLRQRGASPSRDTRLLVFCSLLWNFGGLSTVILLLYGLTAHSWPVNLVRAAGMCGGALFPISYLGLWARPFAAGSREARVKRWLTAAATFNAVWISALLFACSFSPDLRFQHEVIYAVPFNACILLSLGAFVFLRGRLEATVDRLYLALTLSGIWISAIAIVLLERVQFSPSAEAVLMITKQQSPFLTVLGSLFLFARFRASDVLIKNTLRIVLAVCMATWTCLFLLPILPALGERLSVFPGAASTILGIILVSSLILVFSLFDRFNSWAVDRWILRQPDYRSALRQIWRDMATLDCETELFGLVDRSISPLLEIAQARVLPRDAVVAIESYPSEGVSECWELADDDPCRCVLAPALVEVMVPIRVHGSITHVIAVVPGTFRRTLLNRELQFLRNVSLQTGARLEAFAYERERLERQGREERLRRLATEAELKALRAQINPHFLFNSLNTIADLIVADPSKAEAMTVQLAKVFRHVLMHSERPLTKVSEEMDFLRTYLLIEEVRFGARLRVNMKMDPDVSRESIPSLILQPVVENAIKHGLAPKVGQGNLSITAGREGEFVRLAVEDDGVGNTHNDKAHGGGVGLRIIAERLKAIYDGRASLRFEDTAKQGTRVTILIPLAEAVAG